MSVALLFKQLRLSSNLNEIRNRLIDFSSERCYGNQGSFVHPYVYCIRGNGAR